MTERPCLCDSPLGLKSLQTGGWEILLTRWRSLLCSNAPTCCGNGAAPQCPRAEREEGGERVASGTGRQLKAISTPKLPFFCPRYPVGHASFSPTWFPSRPVPQLSGLGFSSPSSPATGCHSALPGLALPRGLSCPPKHTWSSAALCPHLDGHVPFGDFAHVETHSGDHVLIELS